MMASMDESVLQREALRLPPAERALLADALLTSLDGEATRAIESEWVSEADDRLAEYEAGRIESKDGPSVLGSLKNKYGK